MSKIRRKPWTRDELILAINLYCKIPFGKIHIHNPQIIKLAEYLDRTPGSVSYKLANFASIDPSLDRKGASNVSKLDREIWGEFFNDWEKMAFESEQKIIGTYRQFGKSL
jgi:putative restriction endonuclease